MNDERAFPGIGFDRWGEIKNEYRGMTLRDYFAAKALPTVIARTEPNTPDYYNFIAYEAYEIADAMLARGRRDNND